MREDIILATKNLTKEFKGFVVANYVNLRIGRGSIDALIASNRRKEDHRIQSAYAISICSLLDETALNNYRDTHAA